MKTEIKTIRVQLEKLDGGFISDASGKRKIHQEAHEITSTLNLATILNTLEDDMYHLNIDLVPKDKVSGYMDIMALHTQEMPQMTYEQAKAEGIIQPADRFNPHPIKNEKVIEKDIKVTADNAYTIDELKKIDWKLYGSQLSLTVNQKTEISGMSYQAMNAQWKKAVKGTASFHLSSTRIGFTILAKYFEANIDLKVTTKAQLDEIKSVTLEHLQMIELLCSRSGKYIVGSEVMRIVSKMRKPLL